MPLAHGPHVHGSEGQFRNDTTCQFKVINLSELRLHFLSFQDVLTLVPSEDARLLLANSISLGPMDYEYVSFENLSLSHMQTFLDAECDFEKAVNDMYVLSQTYIRGATE